MRRTLSAFALLLATVQFTPARAASNLVTVVVGDCTLEAMPRHAAILNALAADAHEILPRLERDLGVRPGAPYRIILIPPGELSDPELAGLDAAAPAWAAGFIIPSMRVGAIRMSRAQIYPYGDLTAVFTHEVAHILMRDAAGDRLPRWFSEGVATGVERAWGLRDIFVFTSSVLTGRLPTLREMNRSFRASASEARVAYVGSFDFVSWARRKYGPEIIPAILREASERPFAEAWQGATGSSLASSEAAWRRGSLMLYRWVPALTGTTTLWIGVTLLTFFAAARRRARSRAILDRWDAEDGDLR